MGHVLTENYSSQLHHIYRVVLLGVTALKGELHRGNVAPLLPQDRRQLFQPSSPLRFYLTITRLGYNITVTAQWPWNL